ncbi:hypothetical protein [Paraburkholderia sp. CNPSo 3281]|uniref:hypothetical protein n=1 Tax=Paraburkholderia sp. CNPSo 3281 TaxID=2940933 RepID=UPI0020B6BB4E|nr:hypothetical protein [Paraburkholderia sp. CNPSo 3281]MCP3714612.1 hypothetical protein [Paraburkholderia sp. CNPSo 3281]
MSTRQCDFFTVLRVDFAIVGDLPRIHARMPIDADRPLLAVVVFPLQTDNERTTHERRTRAMKMTRVTGCQVYTHEPQSAHKKIKPPRNARGGRS